MRFREQHAICGGYQLTGCHARRASRDEGRLYPDGHFGIYVAEPFERAVKDQLAFLAWHLDLLGVWRTLRALPHVQRHDGYLLAISSMAAFVTLRCRPPTRRARPACGRCATASAWNYATSA